MHFVKKKAEEKRIEFDKKLKSKKILRVPGAYNPLTAKVIEEIGYDAVYVSGGVMSNDLGYPDIGLTTLKDVSNRANQIARVTNLPTIVDIDTGFKSCKETIETFEKFGITGVHIEDQVPQKRCGHLENKELVTKEEMIKKIEECVNSKKDKNFKVIARSDAKSYYAKLLSPKEWHTGRNDTHCSTDPEPCATCHIPRYRSREQPPSETGPNGRQLDTCCQYY